jgi:dTDP-L-rhamnose 4-epimerase
MDQNRPQWKIHRIMKNILITGGAGFIGSNLALKLIKNGYKVTVLDNLSPQIHGEKPKISSPLYLSIFKKVNFINGSVTSREDWEKALEGQNAVIHLAAETGTGQSMYQIQRYVDVNIGGTSILLDILANDKSHTISKIIIASSRAIYGEGKYNCPKHGIIFPKERNVSDMSNLDFSCKCPVCNQNVQLVATTEDSKIHPTSVYGITKHTQEQMVMTIGQSLGIAAVAYRYQNVYGPGQSLTNPYTGILSIFSTRILNKKEINIFEDGTESRDFVYIDDVVDATILGLENKKANGKVYNVGTGKSTDVLTVAKTLCASYKTKVPLNISGNYRIGDIRHNFADTSQIQKDLDFLPKWSFENGIAKFTEWAEKQSIQTDKYEESLLEMKKKGLYK